MEKSCQAEFAWSERNEGRRRKHLANSALTPCEVELLTQLWGYATKRKDGDDWLVAKVAKRQMGGCGFSPESLRKAAKRLSESDAKLIRIDSGTGGRPSTYWLNWRVLANIETLTRSELRAKPGQGPSELGNRLHRVKENSKSPRVSRVTVSRVGQHGLASCQAAKTSAAEGDTLAAILASRAPWAELKDWHVRTGDLRLARHLRRHAELTGVLSDTNVAKLFLAQFHHCASLRNACVGTDSSGRGGRYNAAAMLQNLVRTQCRRTLNDSDWEWAAAQIRKRSESTRGTRVTMFHEVPA